MALRNQPYIPLYVQDYLTDEKLNECSEASQGVYIKIMCVMHKSDEYGTILLKQKDKQNKSTIKNFACKLANHLPFKPDVIESALIELVEEKVLLIEGCKLIQKRMVKDNSISELRAKAGSKGGISAQAKHRANSENEIEYEDDTDNKEIKNKEVKHKHGEYSHVLLTDLQHEKLVADFGRKKAEQLIKRLDEYIQMKGAKYKDHNLVMRSWERKDSESSVDKPMREL